MAISIKGRLAAVAVLAAATCLVALYALSRPFAYNERWFDRSRIGIEQEVRRLVDKRDDVHPQARMVGVRSGTIGTTDSFDDMQPPLDPDMRSLLAHAKAAAIETGQFAEHEGNVGNGTIFVAVAPDRTGNYAWAAYLLTPPRWPMLKIVGLLLTLANLILVVTSLHAIAKVNGGARSLLRSLRQISSNLEAPVAKPKVAELVQVADGIADLARDLKAADRERERLHSELAERERLAVLGRITAGVAHELRNPLALIKLRVDLAKRADDVATVARDLADVPGEIERLDRLVNDLLTIGGRRIGERSKTDLADLARRRAEMLQPLAAERGVTIEVTGSARADVDADSLARVLHNLEQNAVEASPKPGRVRVDVHAEHGRAIVRVIDDGAGVPADRETELFEPFFTTKPEGVGLGLAVSRAIAVTHGGTLAYRRDGDHTAFELELPEVA